VDPGSHRTGYGVLDTDGRTHRLLAHGAVAPPSRLSLPERLRAIHAGISTLIGEYAPAALAVEEVFHSANARSALVLGQARGVVLLAGAQAALRVHAYPPATVKLATTGNGQAAKSQVAFMVARILGLTELAGGDAADALAVALCAAHDPAVTQGWPTPVHR
jgi:crossover junction endodeoxyribonuclease RuvC